jgi:hypothetical protein
MAYLGLGRIAEARQAAQKCLEEKAGNAWFVVMSPIFEPLRMDPQFIPLLKKTGLPF